jgi:glycosyltransferase involved in cell wall biosynthesis
MKVVYLNSSGQMGGAENILIDLLASLRTAQPSWSLHVIAAEPGPLISRAEQLGVDASVVAFPEALARLGDTTSPETVEANTSRAVLARRLIESAPATLGYVRNLRRELGRLRPDAIHTNGLKMHVLGLWARPRRVPVIWHMHDFIRSRPVMARLLNLHRGRCAAAVANSKSVAGDVRAVCGNRLKVHAVYNAVNLQKFSPEGATLDLDARAGVARPEEGTVRVGLLATFGRWKGHRTFVEALAKLPANVPVRGYIIGGPLYQTDGSQHTLKDLRLLASEFGLGEKLVFTGFIENAAEAIRALDIVVHASTAPEPFGLVIAESMACGRALIASQAGGVRELIVEGVNALSHPPGNASVLAKRIEKLALDAGLRRRLGRAARATAEARFDHRRLASELIPIYREVLPHTLN